MTNRDSTAAGRRRRDLLACRYGHLRRRRVDLRTASNAALIARWAHRGPDEVLIASAALAHYEVDGRLPDAVTLAHTVVRVAGRCFRDQGGGHDRVGDVTATVRAASLGEDPDAAVARYALAALVARMAAEGERGR